MASALLLASDEALSIRSGRRVPVDHYYGKQTNKKMKPFKNHSKFCGIAASV